MLTIHIKALSYPGSAKTMLRDLSFTAPPGALLLLTGSNGSGKTSLLNAISGIIPLHIKANLDASIAYEGLPLSDIPLPEKYHLLAYQMADPDAQLFFPDCLKELSFALENMGLEPEDMQTRLHRSARGFGVERFLSRDPGSLSMGQKKLLLLAMCDVLDAPLVLLDEPSAGLGDENLLRLSEWVAHLRRSGRVVIVAEHNTHWLIQPSLHIDLDGYLG